MNELTRSLTDLSSRIRLLAGQTAENVLKIGSLLTEAKSQCAHGEWLPWLESEFGWSDRHARNFMQVHKSFKSENVSNLPIDVSALYLLSAPSTPEPVRKEVIQRAEAGERITHQKAREIKAEVTHEPEVVVGTIEPPEEAERRRTKQLLATLREAKCVLREARQLSGGYVSAACRGYIKGLDKLIRITDGREDGYENVVGEDA